MKLANGRGGSDSLPPFLIKKKREVRWAKAPVGGWRARWALRRSCRARAHAASLEMPRLSCACESRMLRRRTLPWLLLWLLPPRAAGCGRVAATLSSSSLMKITRTSHFVNAEVGHLRETLRRC